MASISNASCLMCNKNTEKGDRRLLNGEKEMLDKLSYLLKYKSTLDADVSDIVSRNCYTCRKCYNELSKLNSLIDKVTHSLKRFFGGEDTSLLLPSSSSTIAVGQKRPSGQPADSATKRIAVNGENDSPKVATTVHVQYQNSRPKNTALTPNRGRDGRSISRGNYSAVIRRCMKDPVKRKFIVSCVSRVTKSEVQHLCSDRFSCLLSKNDTDSIINFEWKTLLQEAQTAMPILYQILSTCTATRTERGNKDAIIGVIISVLAKNRRPQSSLFQKVMSLILYSGHCSQKTIDRLSSINLCVSHSTTIKTISKLGLNHKKPAEEWRNNLEQFLVENHLEETFVPTTVTIEEPSMTDLLNLPFVHMESVSNSSSDTSECVSELSMSTSEETAPSQLQADDDCCSSICAPVFSDILSNEDNDNSHDAERLESSADSMINEIQSTPAPFGYKLVGDNIDKNVRPRYLRSDKQVKSLHYYHSYAVRDRIVTSHLSDSTCNLKNTPLLTIPVTKVLPSECDDASMLNNMTVLVSQILVENLKHFNENYSKVITTHIKHDYYTEMSQKSVVVPLGVLLKDETNHDDMHSILMSMQELAPKLKIDVDSNTEIKVKSVLLGGDQLSTAMARRVISERVNATNDLECVEGIIPVTEDWHTKLCFLTAIFKRLFHSESFMEKGTLYQLKNLLNRSRVTLSKTKIKDFDATDDFFKLVVSGYVVSAAMELLGMSDIDTDPPPSKLLPEGDWLEEADVRRDTMYKVSSAIVKKHVRLNYHDDSPPTSDKKLEYSSLIISLGLLYLEFSDSIKEGDGLRVLRCWRYMLLVFKATGRVNYSIEAFTLLAQYEFLLSERQAHQLIWSRFINTRGLPSHNIPCDLFMEHLNRVCKNSVNGLGANKTPIAITRVAKVVGFLDDVMKNFDNDNSVAERSGHHKVASCSKDMQKIVNTLMKEQCLQFMPNRSHHTYPNIQSNILSLINFEDLVSWMYAHMNELVHGF